MKTSQSLKSIFYPFFFFSLLSSFTFLLYFLVSLTSFFSLPHFRFNLDSFFSPLDSTLVSFLLILVSLFQFCFHFSSALYLFYKFILVVLNHFTFVDWSLQSSFSAWQLYLYAWDKPHPYNQILLNPNPYNLHLF